MRLVDLARARSGDKGGDANIAVVARSPQAYQVLCAYLTAQRVHEYFRALGCREVVRYELPNLCALNFVCRGILGRGGSTNLRIDAQGKALAQALLLMELPDDLGPPAEGRA